MCVYERKREGGREIDPGLNEKLYKMFQCHVTILKVDVRHKGICYKTNCSELCAIIGF